MKSETVVTSKGTTTIPEALRRDAGIGPGTILSWELRKDGIFARRKAGTLNSLQQHIQRRAGTWKGKLSGVELLKRTRP